MTPLLLALDPSIACTGWALVELATGHRIVGAGAFSTKGDIRGDGWALVKVHDDARRGRQIMHAVYALLLEAGDAVACVALEAPLGGQDPEAVAKMHRANQAVHDGIATARPELYERRQVLSVSSYAAKHAATGSKVPGDRERDGKRAAKVAVARAVIARWGAQVWDHALRRHPAQYEREAAYDAGAVALAALREKAVRIHFERPNAAVEER